MSEQSPKTSGDSREMSRRKFLEALGWGSAVFLVECTPVIDEALLKEAGGNKRWGYLVDARKCIGCTACMRACRAENDVPEGYARTWVERYQVSEDGEVIIDTPTGEDFDYPPMKDKPHQAFFVPKICNHCHKSVCMQVCPVGATFLTPDGVVLVDEDRCVGCGYCVQACPYGTRFINPKTHLADKCTLCYHRLAEGLPPACVGVCPTGARIYGDLAQPDSTISQLVRQLRPRVLRPELATEPKCYYVGLDRVVI